MRMEKDIIDVIQLHSDMVLRLAFSYVKGQASAEDITQNVFVKYMTEDKIFESQEHVKAWLLKVTINECKRHFRYFWNSHRVSSTTEEMEAFSQGISWENTEYEMVAEAIMKLPKKYSLQIHLYYYEELSIKEIAKLLNRKENTIMSDLHRARKLLRESLEEYYGRKG